MTSAGTITAAKNPAFFVSIWQSFRLKLITDLAQQSFAPGDILFPFQSLGRATVDDAKDRPTLFCGSDDHFRRIRCGAIDAANLGHVFQGVQDIDRIKAFAEENEKAVARCHSLRISLREFNHGRISAAPADQTFARGLAERQAEPNPWHSSDQCLMNVLDRLDEMRLTENKVNLCRFFDFYVINSISCKLPSEIGRPYLVSSPGFSERKRT